MSQSAQTATTGENGRKLSILLCFLVAMLEGFDIQAMGVAAPKLGAELGLARDILGQALAAANIGLVLGAISGGWLADRLGRKGALIFATLIFGMFTLGTMIANGFNVLFAMRLGAGIGFGMALPNLMALAAELAPPGKKGLTGTLIFCGTPLGGGIVALISWLGGASLGWRELFLLGGIGPVLMAPVLWIFLKHGTSRHVGERKAISWKLLGVIPLYGLCYLFFTWLGGQPGFRSVGVAAPWLALIPAILTAYLAAYRTALFGGGRAIASVLLWATLVPTLVILYLVLNWLPTLVIGKGFVDQASQASVWFNFGSVLGAPILGLLADRFGLKWVLGLAYFALVLSLFGLAQATGLSAIMVLSGAVGFFLLGSNYVLYGVGSAYYPAAMRGQGSGAAMAWGRAGAVAGPIIGGFLLQGGASSASVVMSMAPFAIVALVAAVLLGFAGRPVAE